MSRPFSAYIHVPFCTTRCGYCDFNTYTTGFGHGADRATYDQSVVQEIALVDATYDVPPLRTIYFGGGTPTLLSPPAFARIIDTLDATFGIAPGAEISTEANPDTLTPDIIAGLKRAGITRISMGMQSAVPHVLATLDRTHDAAMLPHVAQWVHDAGLDLSLDLIYATPGEAPSDWQRSLQVALSMHPDHISAYSLVIEPGTAMGAAQAHGRIAPVDPDDAADKYEAADRTFASAGYRWYEISNWAHVDDDEDDVAPSSLRHACVHNMAYWRDWNWWGFGPGAHSHIDNTRMWNKKHPARYAADIAGGMLAVDGREDLTAEQRHMEHVMLAIRTAEGLARQVVTIDDAVIDRLDSQGMFAATSPNLVLSLHGRLLADYVTRELLD